jgi:hypothetical protein
LAGKRLIPALFIQLGAKDERPPPPPIGESISCVLHDPHRAAVRVVDELARAQMAPYNVFLTIF